MSKMTRGGEGIFLGLLGTGIQCTVVPKPVGEVLSGAKVRLGGYGDAVVDGIKVKVWMKIGEFEQILCEVVAFPLPEYYWDGYYV